MAERNIVVIPATRRTGSVAAKEEVKKLRVAAYCRVSTDLDEQATSYEAQVEHYRDYISKNPAWELAGIYADDGISGTGVKKRDEFQRMIDDCINGKIDVIISKSISRFARNTIDCLNYIRQLKALNIPVIFEKENLNTMDSKSEFILTVMASLAQQESESLSRNVKMGIQYRFQAGKVRVNTNWFLGYKHDAEGNLIVDEEQAEVVRRIFREYLEGKSCRKIAKGLMADGIRTGAGRTKWWDSGVMKVLTNEKYMGDALLQKTYTTDVLTKKRVKNDGVIPQYYVENDHEAIISKETFNEVQAEIKRRSRPVNKTDHKVGYCSKYALTGVLYCGECGAPYLRQTWTRHGEKRIVWRCRNRLEKDGGVCFSPTVSEELIHTVVVQAIREAYGSREPMKKVKENVEAVVNAEVDVEGLEERLTTLQEELVQRVNDGKPYDDLTKSIQQTKAEIERANSEKAKAEEKDKQVERLDKFFNEHSLENLKYDDDYVRKLIEEIIVYSASFTVKFKSGTTVEIRA